MVHYNIIMNTTISIYQIKIKSIILIKHIIFNISSNIATQESVSTTINVEIYYTLIVKFYQYSFFFKT